MIFIAPPGAGKGTISSYLESKYGYKHLSTGDLLRCEIKNNTEISLKVKEIMAQGKLIPDEVILPLFKQELIKIKDELFILDGMPRKLNQAEYLTNLFTEINAHNYLVINLSLSEETLRKRITGRRICKSCNSSYNIYFDDHKPIKEGICDKCSNDLIEREDDNLDSFKNRYDDYVKEVKPIIEYYKKINKLITINADRINKEIIKDVDKEIK